MAKTEHGGSVDESLAILGQRFVNVGLFRVCN